MIKFRAWDRKNKVMRDVKGLIWEETNLIAHCLPRGHEFNEWFTVALDGSEYQLMQSTGLKDKNGVEIYVGDIVKGEQWLTTTMPAQIVDQVSYSERNTMFYLGGANESHDRFMHSLGNTIYQYEVVGNIYANPELLSNP